MADQIEEQDVELTEDESVEEAHDPKNAEAQSVASVDKAGNATGTAKLPNMGTAKNNTKKDPMQKIPGTKENLRTPFVSDGPCAPGRRLVPVVLRRTPRLH